MDQPNFQFPRWYQPRYSQNGGGGPFGPQGNAANSFGDIIGSLISQYQQKQDEGRQNDLANALMNNGQVPGVEGTQPTGDTGPTADEFVPPSPAHSGGTQELSLLQALQWGRDRSAQASMGSALNAQRMAMQQKRIDQAQYYIDNPGAIPPGGRKTFAPPRTGRATPSNLLPIGTDPLPGDPGDPNAAADVPGAAPKAGNSVVSTAQPGATGGGLMETVRNIYNSVMSATPNIGNDNASADSANAPGASNSVVSTAQPGAAKPSPTPLVAQGGVAQVSDAPSYNALPSGTTYRDPSGKIRRKP